MIYKLFGWWFRWQACKMSALAMSGWDQDSTCPKLWSMTVFFETYMTEGAVGTQQDFGPKDAVELAPIAKSTAP